MLQGNPAMIVCNVTGQGVAVSGADVVIAGKTYKTTASGEARIPVEAGSVEVTVVKEGFASITTRLTVASGQVQTINVELQRQPTVEEHVTVSATRTDRRLQDVPMRVEVLDKEDLEEEQAQTPGDVVMVLNEKAGIRVQTTAPGLGAAAIRIQGMRGRYTRVLSDGLPLFGEDVQGLGLLQVPPADLGQIEVIKGVASALYGGGALAGVIDLISRRPTPSRAARFSSIARPKARRIRCCLPASRLAIDGPARCWWADTGRRRTMSTAMGGPTWPAIRAASSARASFGTTRRATHCSRPLE
jgi:iron complex outermembrane receptor protein